MLSITLEGQPFDRGYQHGERFASQIGEIIRTYCTDRQLTGAEVRTLARRLLGSTCRQFPELVIEMMGISQGARVDFDEIVLLNLVLATNDLESDAISKFFKLSCSAIGFSDSDVGPGVGKNCDEMLKGAPFYLLETVRPDEGLAYMCISWVGTVWAEAGLNEAGFALMQTGGPSAPDQDGHGIVCNIAPRPVLERCRTTQEAVAMLGRIDVAGWGFSAVLGDTSGAVVVEKTYKQHAVVPAHEGVVFSTNHFVDRTMQGMLPIDHDGIVPNSEARYRTLATLFTKRAWPQTLDGLKSALGYHGADGFVCQHGEIGYHTHFSCVAIPRSLEILLSDGSPCLGKFQSYRLQRS